MEIITRPGNGHASNHHGSHPAPSMSRMTWQMTWQAASPEKAHRVPTCPSIVAWPSMGDLQDPIHGGT